MRGLRTWRRLAWSVLLVLVVTNVALVVVQRTVGGVLHVPTGSMAPALQAGDRIVVEWVSEPALERGDVVVLRSPRGDDDADADDELVVKRVVALPGESIEADGGVIAIDGTTRLREPWLEPEQRRADVEIRLQRLDDDEVFVLGDQRAQSFDSRAYGPVELDDVVGEVRLRIWPPDRFGTLDAS